MNARHLLIAASLLLPAAFAGEAFAACAECGTVVDVKTIEKKGEGTGAGAVIGGVAGGVLGHQIGSGRGNTAATIAGAGAGALAGNEIEKRRSDEGDYRVTVRLSDGREAAFMQDNLNGLRVGDRVRVDGGRLYRY